MTRENSCLKEESLEKEKEIVAVYLEMREKNNLMQRTIDGLTARVLPSVSSSKLDELTNKLRQISSFKSQL
jgi:hypothetical protein